MACPTDRADRAAVVALSSLPGIGPARLGALVAEHPPAGRWEEMVAGRLPVSPALAATCTAKEPPGELLARWQHAGRVLDPEALLCRHERAGITVLLPGDPGWPPTLAGDPDPPHVLFVLGNPGVLGQHVGVAVVGTRRCTRYGLDVARNLGAGLAGAGASVVSGLAAGIDGAGHRGALETDGSPPIGVVASGVDVVYPRGHRQLWAEVAAAGAVVSECPLGTSPTRWRFPARNRIIAALSAAVVVVESPASGGAMHTVDEATRRDRPVLAVPGPIGSPASVGTNRLLADGAAPCCDLDDILLAVGAPSSPARSGAAAGPPEPPPDSPPGRLLAALDWRPTTLDQLVLRTGLSVEEAARSCIALEHEGRIATDGGWIERRA